ncbi:MAG: hypothetical protein NE330_03460, partial [Lentisphaeraceae bacterium]|nr:hypothetical protein [Lentisphaeraceae bacterium]
MKTLKTFLLITLFSLPLYSQGLIKVNGFPIDFLGKYSLEFTEADNKVIKAEALDSVFLTLSNKEIK